MSKNAIALPNLSTLVHIDEGKWYLPEYHLFFEADRPSPKTVREIIREHNLRPVQEHFKRSTEDEPEIFFDEDRLHENLRTITVEVTSGCMLGCPHCYLNGSGKLPLDKPCRTRNVTEERLNKKLAAILDKSKQKKITIQYIGGEPLMRESLLRKAIPTARRMGLDRGIEIGFQIITNGVLLTPDVMRFLDEENVEILLSLEGPAHIQNRLRPFKNGKPTADLVLKNIAGHESKIAVIFLLCKQTRDLTSNAQFFLERGFKGVSFNYAYTDDRDIALTADDTAFILKNIDHHWSFYVKNYMMIRNFRRIIGSLDHAKAQLISCNAGRNYVAMGADGHYYLCQRAYGMRELRMEKLLAPGSKYRPLSVEDFAPCAACWARYVCGGICWFNSWHWSPEYRSIRCDFMRQLIKRVAKIWFNRPES